MLVIPAIDLKDGQAVRLFKGDYNQKTVYSNEPEKLAENFEKMGAKLLHVVFSRNCRYICLTIITISN